MVSFCPLQEPEAKYPTVVPARDFDPARDAARIDTAIKTKGERVQENFLPDTSLPSPPVRKFPLSYVTVIPPLLSPSLTVQLCTGNTVSTTRTSPTLQQQSFLMVFQLLNRFLAINGLQKEEKISVQPTVRGSGLCSSGYQLLFYWYCNGPNGLLMLW